MKECVTHHICDCHAAKLARIESEVDRLKQILARELTENDELGAEFVYVQALKDQNAKMREALKKLDQPIADMNEHFIQRRIARDCLREIEELS